MAEVNKDALYATDGDGHINRGGSSFFMSSLYLCVAIAYRGEIL